MMPVVIVPIRSFSGMARLSAVLDGTARADLIRRLGASALAAAEGAGATTAVVTADGEVGAWALDAGAEVVPDPGEGLNAAAAAGAEFAAGGPWVVLHGDLPGVHAADIAALLDSLDDRPVLAPSKDGGTNAVAAVTQGFPFRFGPGSFRLHLAALRGEARVV
ncbi:MAG: 2-phospho-L-lactate guanylyltransferase, partial [Actinobacteria bacterium]